ncbi:unnamed protein product [Caretta caretta]
MATQPCAQGGFIFAPFSCQGKPLSGANKSRSRNPRAWPSPPRPPSCRDTKGVAYGHKGEPKSEHGKIGLISHRVS